MGSNIIFFELAHAGSSFISINMRTNPTCIHLVKEMAKCTSETLLDEKRFKEKPKWSNKAIHTQKSIRLQKTSQNAIQDRGTTFYNFLGLKLRFISGVVHSK